MSATEILRTASFGDGARYVHFPSQIRQRCSMRLRRWRCSEAPNPMGPGLISVVPLRFDPHSRIGRLIVASTRAAPPKSRSWCSDRGPTMQQWRCMRRNGRSSKNNILGIRARVAVADGGTR